MKQDDESGRKVDHLERILNE